MCTNRPSLSIKIEISRNKVSVSEDVLRLNTSDSPHVYSNCFNFLNYHNFKTINIK